MNSGWKYILRVGLVGILTMSGCQTANQNTSPKSVTNLQSDLTDINASLVNLDVEENLFNEEPKEPDPIQLDPMVARVTQALENLDFDLAVLHLKQLEYSTDPSALLLKAFCTELGIGNPINSDLANELATEAAESEYWEAAQFLAWQSITGYIGDPNLMLAEEWRKKIDPWKKAKPHMPALPGKIMISSNNGYVPRFELVSPWIQKKAIAKDPVAQYNMYRILMDGRSAYANVSAAMNWLNQSAANGYGPAAKMMALYYDVGLVLEKNEEMVIKFLRIAAEWGDVESQLSLATKCLQNSIGNKSVAEEGIRWLTKASDQGNTDAITSLAELYYDGELVEKDHDKAFELYSKAAREGNNFAMHMKAWMIFYGQGIPQNQSDGIFLFEQASESGSSDASLTLAKIYLWGWGTDPSPTKAMSWANKAIDQGNIYGNKILGDVYYFKLKGTKDLQKAFMYYEIVAREGNPESQYLLGNMLLWGRGIKRDLEEAYTWHKLASQKHHPQASTTVLMMEGLGWGTDQVKSHMVDYFQKRWDKVKLTQSMSANIMKALNGELDDKSGYQANGVLLTTIEEYLESPSNGKLSDKEKEQLRKSVKAAIDKEEALQPKCSVSLPSDDEWNQMVQKSISKRSVYHENRPPELYYDLPPEYPPIMRMLQVQETVELNLVIGEDGRVLEHSYEKIPFPEFKEAVDKVVSHWLFLPGIKDRKAVVSHVKKHVIFKVTEDRK